MKKLNIFISLLIFSSCSVSIAAKNTSKFFVCKPPKDIIRQPISIGKFEYVMEVHHDNIRFHSEPIYRWISDKPTSFVKDTIQYSSSGDIIDCIYSTDASDDNGKGFNQIKVVDLKYDSSAKSNYSPKSPNIWKATVNSKKIECYGSSKSCAIKVG